MKKNTPSAIINRLIEAENVSVRSVALKAGIDYVQLSKNLKNNDWNPPFNSLEKIGDALGYSITIRAEKRKNA